MIKYVNQKKLSSKDLIKHAISPMLQRKWKVALRVANFLIEVLEIVKEPWNNW